MPSNYTSDPSKLSKVDEILNRLQDKIEARIPKSLCPKQAVYDSKADEGNDQLMASPKCGKGCERCGEMFVNCRCSWGK